MQKIFILNADHHIRALYVESVEMFQIIHQSVHSVVLQNIQLVHCRAKNVLMLQKKKF